MKLEKKKLRGRTLKYKSQKGITLSALVITIVVLLILAGVAINTIFNENGIMKKAEDSQNKMEAAKNSDLDTINGLNDWLIDKTGQNKGKDGVLELPNSMLLNDSEYSYKLTIESAAYTGDIILKIYGAKDSYYVAATEIKDNTANIYKIRDLLSDSQTSDGIIIQYEGIKNDEKNTGKLIYDTSKLGSELKVKKVEKIKKEYSMMGNLIIKALNSSEITAEDLMPFVQYCATRNELGYTYANKLVKDNNGKSLNGCSGGNIGEVTEDIFSDQVEKQLLTHIVNNEGETIKAIEKAIRDQVYNVLSLSIGEYDVYTTADYIEENKYLNEYVIRLIGNTIIPFNVIFKYVVLQDLNNNGKITTANNGNYTVVVDKYAGLEYRAAASAYGAILEYYPETAKVPESEKVYLQEISDSFDKVIENLSIYWYVIYQEYNNQKMDNIYTFIKNNVGEINIAGLRLGYYTFLLPTISKNWEKIGFKVDNNYNVYEDTKYLEMQGITEEMLDEYLTQMGGQ